MHDVNRALRLRDDGQGPQAIAGEVMRFFEELDLDAVAEVDDVAEEQGIGKAFRSMGCLPVAGRRIFMTHPGELPGVALPTEITVREVLDHSARKVWSETNLHDVDEYEHADEWRELTGREATCPAIRLFLAYWNGEPAATCSLFESHGLARVEMVETRAEFRRRGLAFAVVSAAISQAQGTPILFADGDSPAEQLYLRLGFIREPMPFRRHMRLTRA